MLVRENRAASKRKKMMTYSKLGTIAATASDHVYPTQVMYQNRRALEMNRALEMMGTLVKRVGELLFQLQP